MNKATEEIADENNQRKVLAFIQSILVNKFPKLSRKEIEDLSRQTRCRCLDINSQTPSTQSERRVGSREFPSTSAIMSSKGTRQERRQVVAEVASKLFGVEIKVNNVIDETLEPSIQRPEPTVEELRECLENGLLPESERTSDYVMTKLDGS